MSRKITKFAENHVCFDFVDDWLLSVPLKKLHHYQLGLTKPAHDNTRAVGTNVVSLRAKIQHYQNKKVSKLSVYHTT